MTRPTIPETEFTPRPQAIAAQWGTVLRLVTGLALSDEVLELDDIEVNGAALAWVPEEGTGVRYARVVNVLGATLAIARAVPLS